MCGSGWWPCVRVLGGRGGGDGVVGREGQCWRGSHAVTIPHHARAATALGAALPRSLSERPRGRAAGSGRSVGRVAAPAVSGGGGDGAEEDSPSRGRASGMRGSAGLMARREVTARGSDHRPPWCGSSDCSGQPSASSAAPLACRSSDVAPPSRFIIEPNN